MMKTNELYAWALIVSALTATLTGCKKNGDDAPAATVTIQAPAGGLVVDRYKFLQVSATTTLSNPTYEWKVDGAVISTADNLWFISATEGSHTIILTAKTANDSATATINIVVNKETRAYSKNAAKVFEYTPAPGQFVNTMPDWVAGESDAQMATKAENALKTGAGIHLGGYGGKLVIGFDHAIINTPGKSSFKVVANAFNQWSEPGIIEVSMDANGNGLPDDEWYEIAGSEYNHPKTVKNYEITYYKPNESKVPTPSETEPSISDTTYIRWTDNKGGSGYISKNVFHEQSYYPQWKGATITFKGTKLTSDNVTDLSGSGTYYVSPAFEFGYADNWPNNDPRVEINLDWAVDKDGKPAKLSGIHFIRIYTGIRAEAGWLGEVSTEIMGVEDLGLK